jgi:hypothetical protein
VLLDEKAVLACMAYVELNPIRAKMVDTVETAEYTSIFERIHDKASYIDNKMKLPFIPKPLLGFMGKEHKSLPKGIAFSLFDYLTQVEEIGKIIKADKRGKINKKYARC